VDENKGMKEACPEDALNLFFDNSSIVFSKLFSDTNNSWDT